MASKKRKQTGAEKSHQPDLPSTQPGNESWANYAAQHGLTYRVPAEEAEDAELFRVRLQQWRACLHPADAAEEALVAGAVAASVRMDRWVKVEMADNVRRQRAAIDRWEKGQTRKVNACVKLMKTDPSAAAARLERFTRGCEWLAGEWRSLGDLLDTTGSWNDDTAEHALRLLGIDPADADDDETAAALLEEVRTTQVDPAADPAERPSAAAVRAAREALGDRIDAETERLDSLAETLWEEQDGPSRAEAENLVLVDLSPAGMKRMQLETAAELQMHRSLDEINRRRRQAKRHRPLEGLPGGLAYPVPKFPSSPFPAHGSAGALPASPATPSGPVPPGPAATGPASQAAKKPPTTPPKGVAPGPNAPAQPPVPPAPHSPPPASIRPKDGTDAPGIDPGAGSARPRQAPGSPRPQWPNTPRFRPYEERERED